MLVLYFFPLCDPAIAFILELDVLGDLSLLGNDEPKYLGRFKEGAVRPSKPPSRKV